MRMMAFLKMCFRSNKFESKWMKQNKKTSTSGLVKSNIRQNFSTTAILLYISCIFTRVMNIEILYFDIFNRSFLHCFKHKSVERKKSHAHWMLLIEVIVSNIYLKHRNWMKCFFFQSFAFILYKASFHHMM